MARNMVEAKVLSLQLCGEDEELFEILEAREKELLGEVKGTLGNNASPTIPAIPTDVRNKLTLTPLSLSSHSLNTRVTWYLSHSSSIVSHSN